MINFRYHVVSLIAVFLALGLGIILGTTVIDQALVKRLEADSETFQAQNGALRAENERLTAQLQLGESFTTALLPRLIRGKLAGHTLTLVVQEGVDGRAVEQLSEALVTAGATKPGRLVLTKKWADPAALTDLARAVGSSVTDRTAALREAGSKLGTRLGVTGDTRAASDQLRRLEDAGFVRMESIPRGTFPPPGSFVVVMALGDPETAPKAADMLVPLVQGLSASRPMLAAEPLGSRDSLADRLRGERDLAARVPTVDHVDTPAGRLSAVYALRDLIDSGRVGHFGVHRGTDGVAPAVA